MEGQRQSADWPRLQHLLHDFLLHPGEWAHNCFLHDRPWISPWIKSISKELDIVIHVIASHLSGHCDVICNRLWPHQQNGNWGSETRERCVKIVVLSLFMDSFCRVRNKIMYVLLWRMFLRSLGCYFGVYFPSCEATREINNKITLSWALKQFVTRVHTLLYIYIYGIYHRIYTTFCFSPVGPTHQGLLP